MFLIQEEKDESVITGDFQQHEKKFGKSVSLSCLIKRFAVNLIL